MTATRMLLLTLALACASACRGASDHEGTATVGGVTFVDKVRESDGLHYVEVSAVDAALAPLVKPGMALISIGDAEYEPPTVVDMLRSLRAQAKPDPGAQPTGPQYLCWVNFFRIEGRQKIFTTTALKLTADEMADGTREHPAVGR
jgi:hypothetical protein